MKLVLNLALLLSLVAPAVHGQDDFQCVTCPGGIEFPDADPLETGGFYSCSTIDTLYADEDADGCVSIQFAITPLCCPSQFSDLGKNNTCGWCPNGVTKPDSEYTIELFSSDPLNCGELMAFVAAGNPDPGLCAIVEPAAETCCPGDTGGTGDTGASCQFCTAGVEFPDLVIPAADNLTCAQIDIAANLANETICDTLVQPLESDCCPNGVTTEAPVITAPAPTDPPIPVPSDSPTTGATMDSFQCDWCSGALGLEFPDREVPTVGIDFPDLDCATLAALVPAITTADTCDEYKQAQSLCCPTTVGAVQCDFCSGPDGLENPDRSIDDNGLTCTDFANYALGAPNEAFCQNIELAQGLCCPGSTGVSLPPVAEGEYCYICGNADVEMTKPNFQPYAFGGSDDPDDLVTCAEIEVMINSERGVGESCGSAIAGFTFVFSPSICGCAGVDPPNACKLCDGKSINRDVEVLGEGFTCGEGYDFIKHFASDANCDAPNTEINEVEAICCGGALESGGDSAARFVGAGVFVAFVSLSVGFLLV